MPVELTVGVSFRVFSQEDATTASSRLTGAGFQVEQPAIRAEYVRRAEALLRERGDDRAFVWPADAPVVTASTKVVVNVDADSDEATRLAVDLAVAKLDAAISPIERDEEIQWQVRRLNGIVRLD